MCKVIQTFYRLTAVLETEENDLASKWIVHKLDWVTSVAKKLWYFITEYNYILYNMRKVNKLPSKEK